jgi:hypothetical protein
MQTVGMLAGIEPERGTAQDAEPNQPLHPRGRALAASATCRTLRPTPQANRAFGISKRGVYSWGVGRPGY